MRNLTRQRVLLVAGCVALAGCGGGKSSSTSPGKAAGTGSAKLDQAGLRSCFEGAKAKFGPAGEDQLPSGAAQKAALKQPGYEAFQATVDPGGQGFTQDVLVVLYPDEATARSVVANPALSLFEYRRQAKNAVAIYHGNTDVSQPINACVA